jgi:hypothetical protein
VTSVGEYRIYRNCPVTPALDALVEALTAQRTHEHANGRPAVSSRYLSAAVRNELPTSRHGARGDTEPHLEPGRLRLGSTQPTVAIETNVMAQLVAAGMESGLPERECVLGRATRRASRTKLGLSPSVVPSSFSISGPRELACPEKWATCGRYLLSPSSRPMVVAAGRWSTAKLGLVHDDDLGRP